MFPLACLLLLGSDMHAQNCQCVPTAFDQDGDCWTVEDGDCNDANPDIYPGVPDLCDGIDNDCDPVTNNEFIDDDGDGLSECEGDCDDDDDTHPRDH